MSIKSKKHRSFLATAGTLMLPKTGTLQIADYTVWYSDVPNKRGVRVREGGEVLQTINLDRGCFACMLGGADKKTLFMMAAEWYGFEKMTDGSRTGQVLYVETPVQGVGWP